jgi:hypothetical protein
VYASTKQNGKVCELHSCRDGKEHDLFSKPSQIVLDGSGGQCGYTKPIVQRGMFLIITHDGFQSFLHISYIRQKLFNPNRSFHTMTSSHTLCFRCKQCSNCYFLYSHEMTPTPTKKHVPHSRSPVVCISHLIRISMQFPCIQGINQSPKCPSNTS